MFDEITDVGVLPTPDGPKLRISFGNRTMEVPMSDQVALVLSAGAWMMRESAARAYDQEWGGENPTSRKLRSMPIGAKPPLPQ